MNKTHFEAIAAIIRGNVEELDALAPTGPDAAMAITRLTTNQLVAYFETVNPRFDAARFLTACGF